MCDPIQGTDNRLAIALLSPSIGGGGGMWE